MKLEEKSSQTIANEQYDLKKELAENEQYIESQKLLIRYLERRNEKLQDKIHDRQHILEMRAEAQKLRAAA